MSTDPYAAAGEPARLRPASEATSTAATRPVQPIAAERTVCPSGLALYQGQTVDPLAVANHVGQHAGWHLLLTRSALAQPLSIELPPSLDFLWDWYPPEILQSVSPVLLSPADDLDLVQIVKEAWGQDALVWIFGDCDKATLLGQLTAAVRGDEGQAGVPPERVLGFHLPSAARLMMWQLGLTVAAPLESTVAGLLMESEEGQGWHLYCTGQLDRALATAWM